MSTSVPKFIDTALSMFYQYLSAGRRPNMEKSQTSGDGWTDFLVMMKDARLERFKRADNPDWDVKKFRRVELETSVQVTLRISVRAVTHDGRPGWVVEAVEWRNRSKEGGASRVLYFFDHDNYTG